jgi:hypothetical protein
MCYKLPAIGYWLLAIGYWLLAIGYWQIRELIIERIKNKNKKNGLKWSALHKSANANSQKPIAFKNKNKKMG